MPSRSLNRAYLMRDIHEAFPCRLTLWLLERQVAKAERETAALEKARDAAIVKSKLTRPHNLHWPAPVVACEFRPAPSELAKRQERVKRELKEIFASIRR